MQVFGGEETVKEFGRMRLMETLLVAGGCAHIKEETILFPLALSLYVCSGREGKRERERERDRERCPSTGSVVLRPGISNSTIKSPSFQNGDKQLIDGYMLPCNE